MMNGMTTKTNNMNTRGGVTPLKKRGGKAARKVTAKATGKGVVSGYKGRGGYKKSGGGKNPGGYNVHTRFKPRAKPEGPKGGGGGSDPTSNKPYSFGPDGTIEINNYNIQNTKGGTQNQTQTQNQIQTNKSNEKPENDKIKERNKERSGTETRKGKESLPSYIEFWENEKNWKLVDGKKVDKYGHQYSTFEEFEEAAKDWNRKHGGGGSSSYSESRDWHQTFNFEKNEWNPRTYPKGEDFVRD